MDSAPDSDAGGLVSLLNAWTLGFERPQRNGILKNPAELTELQLAILRAVWERREATVADVTAALGNTHDLARKTVGTLMMRLEQQGVLAHREEGREFVYRATVSQDEVRRATVDRVVKSLFAGDVADLVSHALEAGDVAPGDVDRMRRLLAERSKDGG